MKKIIPAIFALLALFCFLAIGCKKEPETVIVKQERGYVCENSTCKFVETGAKYLTLLDCKSECADNRVGGVEINAKYTHKNNNSNYYVSMGIAYNSNDLTVGAFIDSKQESGYINYQQEKTFNFKNVNLAPGTYYYILSFQVSQSSIVISKAAPFIVKPGDITTITVDLNQ